MITFESYRPGIPFDWSVFPRVNAYFDRLRDTEHWARTAPSRAQAIDSAAA
jgi:glutathione S-transferase